MNSSTRISPVRRSWRCSRTPRAPSAPRSSRGCCATSSSRSRRSASASAATRSAMKWTAWRRACLPRPSSRKSVRRRKRVWSAPARPRPPRRTIAPGRSKPWRTKSRAGSNGSSGASARSPCSATRQEFQRLDKELAEALAAREELRKLDAEVAPITKLKAELVELERLHREDAARREEQAKLTELTRNLQVLDRRIAELGDAEAALARASAEARALAERLEAADTVAQEQQGAWVREKEYANTRRAELLKQHEEVKDQRDKIERLGPEGQCPTCLRPLGAEHRAVLDVLNSQLDVIVTDGTYFKQRIEQLATPPAAVTQAEAAREDRKSTR